MDVRSNYLEIIRDIVGEAKEAHSLQEWSGLCKSSLWNSLLESARE
jgi:hypothetical protein